MDKKFFRYIAIAGLSLIIMTPDAKSATCQEVCSIVENQQKVNALCNLLSDTYELPKIQDCTIISCPLRLGRGDLCQEHCQCRADHSDDFKKRLENISPELIITKSS